jgi:hypothetical protein
MAILLRLLPYILGASVVVGAYFWVDGRGYDRAKAEIEAELVEARAAHEKDKREFQARLHRLAGSIKRRCAMGEPLPECRDLEQ